MTVSISNARNPSSSLIVRLCNDFLRSLHILFELLGSLHIYKYLLSIKYTYVSVQHLYVYLIGNSLNYDDEIYYT